MERSDPDELIIARAERAMAETRLLVARSRRLQQALEEQSGPAAQGMEQARGGATPPSGRRGARLSP